MHDTTTAPVPDVTVPDPDDERAQPIYEGPASAAHTRLIPGGYAASAYAGDTDVPGTLVVHADRSAFVPRT